MATPGRGRFSAALVLLVILAAANLSQGHADYLHKHHSHGYSNRQAEKPLAGVASEDRKLELFPQNPQGASSEHSPDVRMQGVLPQARTVDEQQGRTGENYKLLVEKVNREADFFEKVTWPSTQQDYKMRIAFLKKELSTLKGYLALIKDFEDTLPELEDWHRQMKGLDTKNLKTPGIADMVGGFMKDFRRAEAYNDLLGYYVAKQLTIHQHLQILIQNMPNSQRLAHQTFPVRLAGGADHLEGELQVKIGTRWARACNDHGSSRRLRGVICDDTEYLSVAVEDNEAAEGGTTLGNIRCTGTEHHILLCKGIVMLNNECSPDRRIQLDCRKQ